MSGSTRGRSRRSFWVSLMDDISFLESGGQRAGQVLAGYLLTRPADAGGRAYLKRRTHGAGHVAWAEPGSDQEGDAQLGRSIDGTSSQKLACLTVGTTCPTSSLSRLTTTSEGKDVQLKWHEMQSASSPAGCLALSPAASEALPAVD